MCELLFVHCKATLGISDTQPMRQHHKLACGGESFRQCNRALLMIASDLFMSFLTVREDVYGGVFVWGHPRQFKTAEKLFEVNLIAPFEPLRLCEEQN